MNYRPKVVRCRLKTGGKSIPQIREECRGQGLTYRDFENIQRSNEEFDGLVVLLSLRASTTTQAITCIIGTRQTMKE